MTVLNKIVIVGDWAVGKTTFVQSFLGGKILEGYKATVGVDIGKKVFSVDDEKIIFQLWDLSGQKTFSNIRKQFYNRSDGAIVIYDISRPETFDHISTWYEDVFAITGDIPTVLVANKIDLRIKNPDCLTSTDGQNKFQEIQNKFGQDHSFVEASALLGENSLEPFMELGKIILERNRASSTT